MRAGGRGRGSPSARAAAAWGSTPRAPARRARCARCPGGGAAALGAERPDRLRPAGARGRDGAARLPPANSSLQHVKNRRQLALELIDAAVVGDRVRRPTRLLLLAQL